MVLYCESCERDMSSDFVFCPVCGVRAPNNDPTQANVRTGQNQPPHAQPNFNPNYDPTPPAQPSYNPNTPQPIGAKYKAESTAILLAALLGVIMINGVGHMYAGKVGKGVGLLVGSIVLAIIGWSTVLFGVGIIFLVGYFAIWIWQIFDARNTCREYNEYFARHGQPPW